MGLFGPKSPEEERLKELTGGFLVSDDYVAILEGNGLTITEGENIREKIKKEIKTGSLKTDDILDRLDYLIKMKAKSKGHEPRGYDTSILYPNISTPIKHSEELAHKTYGELVAMLPKFCENCGNDTQGLMYVFCPKCQAYIWNPISDEITRRRIDNHFKIGENLDNEHDKRLTLINELKSKGFSIRSIFLSEMCRFFSYLSMADNVISDNEVEFINEYLHLNLNKKQITNIFGTIDETYEDKLPLSFLIYYEIETEIEKGYNHLNTIYRFYEMIGSLFISCDGKVDPKEKIKFMKCIKNLEKNIKNLKAGRYQSIDISRKQQNAIKIIEKHGKKNENIKTNICSKCGYKNRSNVKFCTQCGNKLI